MFFFGHILNGFIYLAYIYITLMVVHWSNGIIGIVLFLIMYKFASYFQVPLVNVKKLDNTLKSPVYSEFSAAVDGLIPIRCYN